MKKDKAPRREPTLQELLAETLAEYPREHLNVTQAKQTEDLLFNEYTLNQSNLHVAMENNDIQLFNLARSEYIRLHKLFTVRLLNIEVERVKKVKKAVQEMKRYISDRERDITKRDEKDRAFLKTGLKKLDEDDELDLAKIKNMKKELLEKEKEL